MATRRQRRINELLGEELSMLLQGRVDDPRLAGVTITHVETTQDLSAAKVYFTESGADDGAGNAGEGEVEDQGQGQGQAEGEGDVLEILRHTEGLLRTELSGLGLRRVPRLVFARDVEYESGERVLRLLAEIEAESDVGLAGGGNAPSDDAPTERDDLDARRR